MREWELQCILGACPHGEGGHGPSRPLDPPVPAWITPTPIFHESTFWENA